MRISSFSVLIIALVFASCADEDTPCDILTCFNGGAYVDGNCNCLEGYTGTNCENFNSCDTILCLNEATCDNGICVCPPGYFGPNCAEFDSCFGVICQNGGTCIDGSCDCPPNYTGENCEQEITPTSITVTSIQVTQFPLLNENGEPWDEDSNPDIYPEISLGNAVLFLTAAEFVNANPGGFFIWTPGINFSFDAVESVHTFTLYDDDQPDFSEEMGTVDFIPYVSGNNFPENLLFTEDSISFSLQVEYNF